MFEVGKKVICIKNHSQGVVKKGDVRELLGIRKALCKCGGLDLDIGIATHNVANNNCIVCNMQSLDIGGIYWFDSRIFAPYDDTLSTLTADELIESLSLQTV
jgi:hypothetical protein